MNHSIKRICTVIVTACMSIGLAIGLGACGGMNDEAQIRLSLTTVLDALKNPTEENIGQFIDASDSESFTQLEEYGIDVYEMFGHLFSKFDYSVGDIKVDGDTATADVSMTNVDLQKAMDAFEQTISDDSDFTAQVIEKTTNNDEKGMYNLIFDKLYELIDNEEETVTSDITVNLTKENGKWDVDDSSIQEFVSSMYGGLDMSDIQ